MPHPFLTARWEHLIFLNFPVVPVLLAGLVPRGTELDTWDGVALISLVGFHFRDTAVRGLPIPGHRHFEEVNLRFYVRRREAGGGYRRAVVFVRELVPRVAIAAVARWVYNEPYLAVPMSHATSIDPGTGGTVRYDWRYRARDYTLAAEVDGPPTPCIVGTEAEFITEHYWGYTRQRDGSTLEYQVDHPPWRVWTPTMASFEGPGADLYGEAFGAILGTRPQSAFVAEGSHVAVHAGRRLIDRMHEPA